MDWNWTTNYIQVFYIRSCLLISFGVWMCKLGVVPWIQDLELLDFHGSWSSNLPRCIVMLILSVKNCWPVSFHKKKHPLPRCDSAWSNPIIHVSPRNLFHEKGITLDQYYVCLDVMEKFCKTLGADGFREASQQRGVEHVHCIGVVSKNKVELEAK